MLASFPGMEEARSKALADFVLSWLWPIQKISAVVKDRQNWIYKGGVYWNVKGDMNEVPCRLLDILLELEVLDIISAHRSHSRPVHPL